MLYNSLHHIGIVTTSEQTNNSASTTTVIPTSDINSTSESSLSDNDIDPEVLVIKCGRPSGTTNKDKKENKQKILEATEKAAVLWK